MKQKYNTWEKRPCVRFNTTRKTFTKTLSLISKLQCKKLRSTNRGRHLPPTLHFSGFFFPPSPAKCFLHHNPPSHFIFKIQISIYKNTVYFRAAAIQTQKTTFAPQQLYSFISSAPQQNWFLKANTDLFVNPFREMFWRMMCAGFVRCW